MICIYQISYIYNYIYNYIYISYIYIIHLCIYPSCFLMTCFSRFPERPGVSVHVEVHRATQVRGVEGLNLTWPVADFQITTVRSSRCKTCILREKRWKTDKNCRLWDFWVRDFWGGVMWPRCLISQRLKSLGWAAEWTCRENRSADVMRVGMVQSATSCWLPSTGKVVTMWVASDRHLERCPIKRWLYQWIPCFDIFDVAQISFLEVWPQKSVYRSVHHCHRWVIVQPLCAAPLVHVLLIGHIEDLEVVPGCSR